MLSLKRMLQLSSSIAARSSVAARVRLAPAKERAHILEGPLRALDILDEVIATIRRSRTVETGATT